MLEVPSRLRWVSSYHFMNSNLNVYVLTYCTRVENLYGTTLIFKTLRTGFPSAFCHVVDNNSLVEVRPTIRAAAVECDVHFTQLNDNKLDHHEFIWSTLATQAEGAAVFVDADLILWENVENWTFGDALLAGRRIPTYLCPFSQCVIHERLHSSFLWVPDVAELIAKVRALRGRHFAFEPFQEFMFNLNKRWQTIDTGGGIYNALTPSQIHAFNERELNAFDHLLYGSYFKAVVSALEPSYADKFTEVHKLAQTDYTQIKGAWRMQSDFFKSLAVSDCNS